MFLPLTCSTTVEQNTQKMGLFTHYLPVMRGIVFIHSSFTKVHNYFTLQSHRRHPSTSICCNPFSLVHHRHCSWSFGFIHWAFHHSSVSFIGSLIGQAIIGHQVIHQASHQSSLSIPFIGRIIGQCHHHPSHSSGISRQSLMGGHLGAGVVGSGGFGTAANFICVTSLFRWDISCVSFFVSGYSL